MSNSHRAFIEQPLANPYYSGYSWWFDDEMGHEYGPYELQSDALRALLQHMAPEEPRRSLWQRLKDALNRK